MQTSRYPDFSMIKDGSTMTIVSANELSKSYGSIPAVRKISFGISKGEIFGFLGQNGAGKTTTINMLCTLLKPSSGTALVNGYDILKQRNLVRRSIGLVFQDSSLDEYLTAQENLRFHALNLGHLVPFPALLRK